MKRMMVRHLGALAGLLLAATSRGDVFDFAHTLYDYAGGGHWWDYNRIDLTSGNSGVPGETGDLITIPVPGLFRFFVDWTSVDVDTFDYVFYAVNGDRTVIAYNQDQPLYGASYQFPVNAGDTITLGVGTTDGEFGSGNAVFYNVDFWSLFGFDDFAWSAYSSGGGGAFTFPPPTLRVVGGDQGIQELNDIYTYQQTRVWNLISGNYSSPDSEDFDQGYVYTTSAGYQIFIQNDTQGPFSNLFFFAPGIQTIGYGVFTADGFFGPGTLTVDSFTAYMYPAHAEELDFSFFVDDAGGQYDITYLDPESFWDFTIFGGDAGVGGSSKLLSFGSQFDGILEAWFEYYSGGDVGDFDYAFYEVDGDRTVIADNDSEELRYRLQFPVRAGQKISFGVATVDGEAGRGRLDVASIRVFLSNTEGCYADFTGDGTLDLFDFLGYVNLFNAGEPAADCDGDGDFTLFDFLCFTNAFNAGC
jgi:hypothetical protein